MKELKILNAKIPDFETDTWEVADILINHGTILKVGTVNEDTLETMYDANSVGLAAPQVGILKRVVVIDVSEEGTEPYILINPRIVESSGEQTGQEGCLSLPGKSGQVTRPNYVKVVALDVNMKPIEVEGQELLARALCHELDHLDGHMYVEKVEGELYNTAPPAPDED